MIECVIFDCDGVLVDSEHLGNVVLAELFAEQGADVDPHVLTDRFRGWKLQAMLEQLHADHNVQIDIEHFRQRQAVRLTADLKAIPGITAVLTDLTLPRCVASSAPPEKIELVLGLTNLRRFFGDNIFSAYGVGRWKPEPDLFLHAAATMGHDPAACLVVEDSEVGIQAAQRAGMHPVLYDPTAARPVPTGVTAIRDMGRLPDVLARLSSSRSDHR